MADSSLLLVMTRIETHSLVPRSSKRFHGLGDWLSLKTDTKKPRRLRERFVRIYLSPDRRGG